MSAIKLNNITVYCGSNFGEIPDYYHHAQILGERLAHHNIRLIYGGGNVGLMGTLADSTLSHGGEVIGVIPTFLKQKEVAHLGLTELIETPDMVTRKPSSSNWRTALSPWQAVWGRMKSCLKCCPSLSLISSANPSVY